MVVLFDEVVPFHEFLQIRGNNAISGIYAGSHDSRSVVTENLKKKINEDYRKKQNREKKSSVSQFS